ncbi:CPBP family glutamic-type intramembrane protease [Micrococcoides hystricis]|uniref:Type II CAAX prenyl endopeptidase Rce1 family protein n=1 Tax=Micrococcoides hystricis TaxID=1572761 RepID=A0ABV6P9S0_9MICC
MKRLEASAPSSAATVEGPGGGEVKGMLSWPALAAACCAAGAVGLFGFFSPLGYLGLIAAIVVAALNSRRLFKDIVLIAGALALISTISLEADISVSNMLLMGTVLALAVAIPYWISRYVYKDHAIRFPRRTGQPWSRLEWGWLLVTIFLAWLILPAYFLGTGVYQNWPAVQEWHEIARLFVGVNAVGIWDELFFICTIFTLLRRHLNFWTANIFTSVIFVSFLWELGYQSIGPALTIPFALVQAWIFTKTKSLPYTITVHLLFDAIVFLTIVHAHHPEALPIFPFV